MNKTEKIVQPKRQLSPMYKVILLNDDHHSCDEVVTYLIQIFRFGFADAFTKMLTAHTYGRAILVVTHLERAELYVEQLTSATLLGHLEIV